MANFEYSRFKPDQPYFRGRWAGIEPIYAMVHGAFVHVGCFYKDDVGVRRRIYLEETNEIIDIPKHWYIRGSLVQLGRVNTINEVNA